MFLRPGGAGGRNPLARGYENVSMVQGIGALVDGIQQVPGEGDSLLIEAVPVAGQAHGSAAATKVRADVPVESGELSKLLGTGEGAALKRQERVEAPRHKLLHARGTQGRSVQFFDGVVEHIEDAAARVQLTRTERARLLRPEREIEVRFPVTMDDGTVRRFRGYRTIHNTLRGAGKGGIRMAPGLEKKTVRALAMEMPMKPSIFGLPLGGAKGGIDADPAQHTNPELARIMRGYVGAVMDDYFAKSGDLWFGPKRDVPAPDVGTSPPGINLMDVCVDQYLQWLVAKGIEAVDGFPVPKALRDVEPSKDGATTPYLDRYLELFRDGQIPNIGLAATFTGKSVEKGGSRGRSEATGLGVAFAAIELLKHLGELPKDATRFSGQTAAVHGFGNVGAGAVRAFERLGAKVVAIAEFDGAPYVLHRPEGFDAALIGQLEAHKRADKKRSIRSFPEAQALGIDEFWKLPVDFLVPAAKENVLTIENAGTVGARFVDEGANGPTTAEADEILGLLGKTVIPDIFANAAGVTVSYFEMVQNMTGEVWSEAKVEAELRKLVKEAFRRLADRSAEGSVSLRDAAFDVALLAQRRALRAEASA